MLSALLLDASRGSQSQPFFWLSGKRMTAQQVSVIETGCRLARPSLINSLSNCTWLSACERHHGRLATDTSPTIKTPQAKLTCVLRGLLFTSSVYSSSFLLLLPLLLCPSLAIFLSPLLRAREQDLTKRQERELAELSSVHSRETQNMLSDFNKAQEVLKDKISALQIL